MNVARFQPAPAPAFNAKPFTWTYSKLKNYESCAQKHLQVDLAKTVAEKSNPKLEEGNELHDAMKTAIGTSNHILPPKFAKYQSWVTKSLVETSPYQIIKVEQKLAITKAMQPCDFFDRNVWLRGIVDYAKFVPSGAGQIALLLDWKTGKVLDDAVQLALFAQLIFAHYPTTRKIRTEYVWLAEDSTTREDFERKDMVGLWTVLKPRVDAMENSYVTGQYPAVKNGLCKEHCPVTTCAHNGRYAGG